MGVPNMSLDNIWQNCLLCREKRIRQVEETVAFPKKSQRGTQYSAGTNLHRTRYSILKIKNINRKGKMRI
jgi:hypothetical protein